MSQKLKLKQQNEASKTGIKTFKLGLKSQSESKPAGSKPGPDRPVSDEDKGHESTSDVSQALARLAVLARDGNETDRGQEPDGPSRADPSPQAMIDDPDYTSTFNILNELKGKSAKGDFSNLEIPPSDVDLTSVSDRIFDTAWSQAKKAVKSPTKSVRVKKLLAALDEGDATKMVIPSVPIMPDEPMCNFIYQSASASHIDAFTSKISNPFNDHKTNSTNTSTNNK